VKNFNDIGALRSVLQDVYEKSSPRKCSIDGATFIKRWEGGQRNSLYRCV